jgi:hypothetical protein
MRTRKSPAPSPFRLRHHHQIDVYLDVIDSKLDKNGPDLADYIRAEMEKCTQLLAVISRRLANPNGFRGKSG